MQSWARRFASASTKKLLFRAVLLAVSSEMRFARTALLWSPVAFGMWRVLITVNGILGNAATDPFDGRVVVGSVMVQRWPPVSLEPFCLAPGEVEQLGFVAERPRSV